MPSSKQRVFVPLLAILVITLGGMLIGSFSARSLVRHVTNEQLGRYADHVLGVSDAASDEAATVLIKIDSSTYQHCSASEIAYFQSLIFKSFYLKDAGHMLLNRIECSSMLGSLKDPLTVGDPTFSSQKGTHVFKTLPKYATGGVDTIGAQLGDAYVVFSPWIFFNTGSLHLHFTVTIRDKHLDRSGYLSGEEANIPLSRRITSGQGELDGMLFATRCSNRYLNCVTTYVPLSQPLEAQHSAELTDMAIGGLIGLIFGFLWSLYYRRNRSLDHQLRRAVKVDQFRMVYQPIIEVISGRVVGAEALIRWDDEEGRPVNPETFIALAEERGLIRQITRLVVRHVLDDMGETLRQNPGFRVSINVSASDLGDTTFLGMLEKTLKGAGVSPSSVAIEITERCTACNPAAVDAVHSLRNAGFSVHIDDFGTGYSSLSCLHNLDVDTIKVDRAFIHAIGTGSVKQGILPQILAMAESLNLEVILEGVETQVQVDYFIATGKPLLAQGWYFGRPVPSELFKFTNLGTDTAIDEPELATTAV